jgi:fructokinase
MHHLNGYLLSPQTGREIDSYIVPPGLGGRSGLLGSMALGRMALDASR